MNSFNHLISSYLLDALGVEAELAEYHEALKLPLHLRSLYRISMLSFTDHRFLVLMAKSSGLTPKEIDQHRQWIEQRNSETVIYAAESLASHSRKRLVERKVPFIVPGNQLYLPMLGIDFREYFRAAGRKPARLSPSAQVVVIGAILGKLPREFTATELGEFLNYSKMSMSRALDELYELDLIDREHEGRKYLSRFREQGKALWDTARTWLRTPVVRKVHLESIPYALEFRAGLSSLSEKSMLSPPEVPVWAMDQSEWKRFEKSPGLRLIPEGSADQVGGGIEIWRYAPSILSKPPDVDPFSLALSLMEEHDERVEGAVEEMLEDFL